MKRVHAFTDDVLGDLDAVGVARAVEAGEFSAREATDAAVDRIDRVNPQLAAVAYDDRERARVRAAENGFSGAFAGVPTLIKNNTDYAGLPTRQGSAAVADRPAAANEPFTEEFLGAGVNVVGASTMPAFGLTATTEFADREPTRNPWDTDYSCGASSGGAAALVAAGAVPIAHANDGGGSIRIPAAACGLVGLKPTRGRTAGSPASAKAPIDLVCNGIVSRSVRDTAYFLADLERQRRLDTLDPVGLVEGPSTARLRVALMAEPITGVPLDADTRRAVDDVVALLTGLGHHVEEAPLPVDPSFVGQFTDYWGTLALSFDRFGGQVVGPGFDRNRLDPFTKGLARMALRRFYRIPASIVGLRRAVAKFRNAFGSYDVILTPTLGHTTPEIGYLDPAGRFDEVFERLIQYVAFTPADNACGTPAISLPLGQASNGLPIGIHFSADRGAERTLLSLAFELEAAAPFARIQDA
ncbi:MULTISPECIES: amidase [unclassified Gordonia (in: high G+C Gram-positive bacteria)]|uniref:amidase n=1 Tax=unclassified Gordonia (in: high G+C Gram-positive bacteria) TaxID=2657482 RepID=UPI001FFEECCE|nr:MULTISPECIES: amidase [unclassified Gordonia (in: high G+C Gram-positive bacteria)]UQE74790.1 amidase [Gordonia sp. PP30]